MTGNTPPGGASPTATHPTIAKATELLKQQQPGFRPADFRAVTRPTPDGGGCLVTFDRVAGAGRDQFVVYIATADDLEDVRRKQLGVGTGSPAPPVAGGDVYGDRVALDEYRGKVVLFLFCSPGCGPCRVYYERGKQLAERFAGRPFAVLGVVGCCTRAEGKGLAEQERLPWRLLWDGETWTGPVHQRWGVDRYPSVWLIDHLGRIASYEAIPEFIDGLVAQAEAAVPE